MREQGVYPEADAVPQGVNAFAGGLVAMQFEGSWATNFRRETVGDNFVYDVTYFPFGTTGKRAVTAYGGAWGMAETAGEAAWEFLKHLTSTESAIILISEPLRSLPGRKSAVPAWLETASKGGLPPEHVEVFADQMEEAWAPYFPPFYNDFVIGWTNRIVPLLSGGEGNVDVAATLAQFQQEVNDIIALSEV